MQRPEIDLDRDLSFGFEQTFTTPDWWTEPGFVATSDTPLKRAKMLALAEALVAVQGGSFRQSLDLYQHLQYETFLPDGSASFVVTMDPGSIEVKTQPVRAAQVETLFQPLFIAAERAALVAYRNWWYGVKGGTEGGCHVNMGGFSPESNPWRRDPLLLLQYAGFLHNHPEVHYPFMGVDTGPGGNAVRMDENEEEGHASILRWREARERLRAGEPFTAERFEEFFRGTRLADDRHSAPSFYKYKAPLYLVEDRAQEAFRSAEDARLACELRLAILKRLQAASEVDDLQAFGSELHAEILSLGALWPRFVETAHTLGIHPDPYFRFFERQFPVLTGGEGGPEGWTLREGRRPRVITDVKKRGDLVISKTIDTRHKRLEAHWSAEWGPRLRVGQAWVEGRLWDSPQGPRYSRAWDCFADRQDTDLEIQPEHGSSAVFRLHDMMFREAPQSRR
jgi:hypothetical protein